MLKPKAMYITKEFVLYLRTKEDGGDFTGSTCIGAGYDTYDEAVDFIRWRYCNGKMSHFSKKYGFGIEFNLRLKAIYVTWVEEIMRG